MDRIKNCLKSNLFSIIKALSKSKGINLYLVGGTVRDILLDRESKDYDFTLSNDVLSFAKYISVHLKGSLVFLDKALPCVRIVCKIQTVLKPQVKSTDILTVNDLADVINLDFSRFRYDGNTIEEDIAGRDFTINSIAINLGTDEPEIIDPFNGLEDLKKMVIRVIHNQAFKDDPLRMLRAVRLSSELCFLIEDNTQKAILKSADLINQVSKERIISELYLILKSPNSATYIDQLERLTLLEKIVPEIIPLKNLKQQGFHHLSGWEHTLFTLMELENIIANLERFFPKWHKKISKYLEEIISEEHTRLVNLKLAAILHDIGKPITKRIDIITGKATFYCHDKVGAELAAQMGHRLRLSNKEIDLLKMIVSSHMRPGFLVDAEVITDIALYRLFKDLGDAAVATLILSLSDRYAALGENVTSETLQHYYQDIIFILDKFYNPTPKIFPPKLLNGNEIMERFSLGQDKRIGQLLAMVEDAFVQGKIHDKKDALRFVEDTLKQRHK